MLWLARFNQGHRRIARRAFRKFTVLESQQQVGFIVSRYLTKCSAFIFALADVRREIPQYFRDFRTQQPTPTVDHMRSDRAQSSASLLHIRPPVPRPVGIGPRVGTKSELRVPRFADLAPAHQF